MQPDRGALCAFWVASLISVLRQEPFPANEPPDTPEALIAAVRIVRFQELALRHLLCAIYTYTAAIVPQHLRTELVQILGEYNKSCFDSAARRSISPDAKYLIDTKFMRQATCTCLIMVLSADDVYPDIAATARECGVAAAWQHAAHERWYRQNRGGLGQDLIGHLCDILKRCPAFTTEKYNRMCAAVAKRKPHALALDTIVVLRGCGLVASASGMRNYPDVVMRLVNRWQAGPCVGRLQHLGDYIIHFDAMHASELAGPSRPAKMSSAVRAACADLGSLPAMRASFSANGGKVSMKKVAAAFSDLEDGAQGRAAFLSVVLALPEPSLRLVSFADTTHKGGDADKICRCARYCEKLATWVDENVSAGGQKCLSLSAHSPASHVSALRACFARRDIQVYQGRQACFEYLQ